ncbi:MAG: hypothetical protein ACRDP8_19780 [Actinopolymorphaceae bacterium]
MADTAKFGWSLSGGAAISAGGNLANGNVGGFLTDVHTMGPESTISWESDDVEDGAWDLVGLALESVSSGDPDLIDPVFHFRGDLELEVRADTDLDPWTLTIPGLVITGRRAS